MAKAILNARIYLGEVDLSGFTNACALNLKTDIVECTSFSDSYKDKLAGLTDVIVDVSGYFSADAVTGNPDKKMWDKLSLNDTLLTICPEAGATGTKAYFFKPTLTQYDPWGGKVSEMNVFKLHGEGAQPLVKGTILLPYGAKTTTGNGTAYQLGALSASQTIYCGVHIFAVSGTSPTLDLILQSDNAVGFPHSANQITFTQKNAVGSDYQTKVGAVADDWWRISYTIGGGTPSFTLAVVAGIK